LATEHTAAAEEFPDDRFELVDEDKLAARVAVAALLLAGVILLVRLWLTRKISTPWILLDELIYSELATSFAERGRFLVREDPIGWFNFGYAGLISPAWILGPGPGESYSLAKGLNLVFVSSAAIPVYLWTRRLTSATWAALAALLVLLMPSLLYAGMLMSENAFLPLFVLTCWTIARAIERPSIASQGVVLAAVAVAAVVRVQGVVLIAIFATAVLVNLAFELPSARGSRVRLVRDTIVRYWFTAAVVLAGAVLYVGFKAIQGDALVSGLGSYRVVGEVDYFTFDAARWIARHFADVALATGVFPVAALIVLLWHAARPDASLAERAFLGTTLAAVIWIVLQAAFFASRFAFRIEERYMFCVFPLLLMTLVLWLARGAPRRPWPVAVVAAGVPVLLVVLALPLQSLLNVGILSDTFALIPLLRLSQLTDGVGTVEVVLAMAAVGAGAAFLALPRRLLLVAPAAIAVYFTLGSYAVHGAIRDYAAQLRLGTVGPDPGWVDRRVPEDAEVDILFGGSPDLFALSTTIWETEIWNRSLKTIYSVSGGFPAGGPEVKATIDPATGRVLESDPRDPGPYVLASQGVDLVGSRRGAYGRVVLHRIDPPLRLARLIDGVYGDGWMGADASLTQYATAGRKVRRMQVNVSRTAWRGPDVPGDVRVRSGTFSATAGVPAIGELAAERTGVIHSAKALRFTVPVPPPPFRIEVHVEPTFSPSQFGERDVRQLGAQVVFRPLRR
jgi:Dolichyl-phosphate-mannose-protein mannosyltransferase